MHDVIVAKACMNSAQRRVDERIEMLGSDGWQAYDPAPVALSAHSGFPDMTALRTLHLTHPEIPKICLMETESREVTVQAFRSAARGLFSLADSSFQLFCECIERVHRGEIFATTEQLNYLLESVCQVPSLRVVGASGEKLLTSREEQVVALVTDGLSNRDVATELGLSQHTVKKYLFRIFEKTRHFQPGRTGALCTASRSTLAVAVDRRRV